MYFYGQQCSPYVVIASVLSFRTTLMFSSEVSYSWGSAFLLVGPHCKPPSTGHMLESALLAMYVHSDKEFHCS